MNKMNVAIIEDEKLSALRLERMIKEIRPDWSVNILPGSIYKAFEWFSQAERHPDLIFLDIQLADGTGFDFLSMTKPESVIIFTTAYDQYALEAFKVRSVDYLLKPINDEELKNAINKFEDLTLVKDKPVVSDYEQNLIQMPKRYRERILITNKNTSQILYVNDVAFFYQINKVTIAITFKNQEIIINSTLDKLMSELNPDIFFRANRQFIISIHSIDGIEPYFNNRITVHTMPKAPEKIIVSKEKAGLFKIWMNY